MLEFEVFRDRKELFDLQRTHLEFVACIVQLNDNVLRSHATDTVERDTPHLLKNPLSYLFSERTMCLSGEKKSATDAIFLHKKFISPGNDAKQT